MKILGQEIDVFRKSFSDTHDTIIFAKNLERGVYERLTIEMYLRNEFDINQVRYNSQANVDGTLDPIYPLTGESKLLYKKSELPPIFQRAMIFLLMEDDHRFKGFFNI